MPGYALLVGVDNAINQKLLNTTQDVANLSKILKNQFFVEQLTNERATKQAIIDSLKKYADKIQPDDLFVFYFSSHGGQRTDTHQHEIDGKSETLVAYDGEIVDLQLHRIWKTFQPKCRILMLSDCCNSGTNYGHDTERPVRVSSPQNSLQNYCTDSTACRPPIYKIPAFLLHIGAAQDGTSAFDTGFGGLFTNALIDVFTQGGFKNYYEFYERIRDKVIQNSAKIFPLILISIASSQNKEQVVEQIRHDLVAHGYGNYRNTPLLIGVRSPQTTKNTDQYRASDIDQVFLYGRCNYKWLFTQLDCNRVCSVVAFPKINTPNILDPLQIPPFIYTEIRRKDAHRGQEPQFNLLSKYAVFTRKADDTSVLPQKISEDPSLLGVPLLVSHREEIYLYGKKDDSPFLYRSVPLDKNSFQQISYEEQKTVLSVSAYHEIDRNKGHEPMYCIKYNPFASQMPFDITPPTLPNIDSSVPYYQEITRLQLQPQSESRYRSTGALPILTPAASSTYSANSSNWDPRMFANPGFGYPVPEAVGKTYHSERAKPKHHARSQEYAESDMSYEDGCCRIL